MNDSIVVIDMTSTWLFSCIKIQMLNILILFSKLCYLVRLYLHTALGQMCHILLKEKNRIYGRYIKHPSCVIFA